MSDTTLEHLGARSRHTVEFGRDALIVCDNLVRIYQTGTIEVQALQGLDLLVDAGEMIAVVGASGSGKSTLLAVLSGIDAPTTLAVGEEGTWTLHAATNASGNLHYSVVWGDESASPLRAMALSSTEQSSATFTHVYDTKGTYAPKFTVSDDNGHSASVSASVVVKAK